MLYFLLTTIYSEACDSGSGMATFYDVNNAAENDGYTGQVSCQASTIPEDGLYAAVSSNCFSQAVCNSVVTVSYNGKSIQVPIIDECASCDSNHIDLSEKAFSQLESNLDIGELHGTTWLPSGKVNSTNVLTNVKPAINCKNPRNRKQRKACK